MWNPRSFRPTTEDDEPARRDAVASSGAERREHAVGGLARNALRETIAQIGSPETPLAMMTVSVTGLFADLMGGLSAAPTLAALINERLERSGWRLVPISRNREL